MESIVIALVVCLACVVLLSVGAMMKACADSAKMARYAVEQLVTFNAEHREKTRNEIEAEAAKAVAFQAMNRTSERYKTGADDPTPDVRIET